MNKRGLIGKIFLIIGIIILAIGIIIGITAYQGYRVYQIAQQEQTAIQEDIKILSEQRDCARVDSIQTRFLHIKSEAESACLNPIIKIAAKKIIADKPMSINGQNLSISCENLNTIYDEMSKQFGLIKEACNNINTIKTAPIDNTTPKTA